MFERIMKSAWILPVLAIVFVTGCASSDGRLARYRPDVSGVEPWSWRVAPVDPSKPGTSGGQPAEVFSKILKPGDKISVTLRDIPAPESISYEINDRGSINLPLVGAFIVEGKKPSEAESQIEKAYIDGGFYKKIKVVVIAQDDKYTVRGEVKKEGEFQLSPNTTLLRAISAAGGITDYAKTWAVELKRGEQVTVYDIGKISDGKEADPQIKHSDVINVPRRWM